MISLCRKMSGKGILRNEGNCFDQQKAWDACACSHHSALYSCCCIADCECREGKRSVFRRAFLPLRRLVSASRTAGPEAVRSSCADSVREIHRNTEGGWLLLCESLLHLSQSRVSDETQPKRGCFRCSHARCRVQRGSKCQCIGFFKEAFLKNHDPEQ